MSTQNTTPSDSENDESRSIPATVADRVRDGTVPAAAGAVLLADALLRRGRRPVRLAVGGALLLFGLQQRRSAGNGTERDGTADRPDATGDDDQMVSADAKAHLEQSKVLHQGETNPRGIEDEPDVETDPDEGEIRFSTDRDEGAETKPNLEGAGVEDPRYPDEDDPLTSEDHVDVDLSEAAMADEASEAVGPAPEQSYPAFEGTDPEPTSMEAPERSDEAADADAGSADGSDATEEEKEAED